MRFLFLLLAFASVQSAATRLHADDGYRLWLAYDQRKDDTSPAFRAVTTRLTLKGPASSQDARAGRAREELQAGLAGILAVKVEISFIETPEEASLGGEGFEITRAGRGLALRANTGAGLLYGAFELLRRIQTVDTISALETRSVPAVTHRLLNHWDNLDRTVERGYAGASLWDWSALPAHSDPRYRDYARACASLGINGTVLTNVNANARVLTGPYLEKVAALAAEFRPYGLRVYLTARFSAPIEIGGLTTADPLNPDVRAWWKAKIDEIFRIIPDFGGFVVKANSEGQPGPQDYHRTHADGANMFAEPLAAHGGIVMWRAFVYSPDPKEDRVRQAVNEFEPLDGKLLPNVVLQVKNGPLDFMPREPFSPLFGKMPGSNLGLELQITQEYLGQAIQACFLAPLWKEVFDADTYAKGQGSTVAKRLHETPVSVVAGVSNVGSDRNWTGHRLAQANWYAFGRLAWNPALEPASLAEEWTRQTFGQRRDVVDAILTLLLSSRDVVLNHSMPLGLHHIMAEGHHYGPGPWVSGLARADWNSTYYHRADENGLGFDRTSRGSRAVEQYAPELQRRWSSLESCPEGLLLWFHHVAWDQRLSTGRTLWNELCLRYQQGVDGVRGEQRLWEELHGKIDEATYEEVRQRLLQHEKDAVVWRDACLLYFQQFSKRPLPEGVEKPAYPLDHYKALDTHSGLQAHP